MAWTENQNNPVHKKIIARLNTNGRITYEKVKDYLKERISHHHFWYVNTGEACSYSNPEKHYVAMDELEKVLKMLEEIA